LQQRQERVPMSNTQPMREVRVKRHHVEKRCPPVRKQRRRMGQRELLLRGTREGRATPLAAERFPEDANPIRIVLLAQSLHGGTG
jgi:hypothetical protein